MYSYCTRKFIFPCLALLPPVAVAFATNNLEFLVGITGSYAGKSKKYFYKHSAKMRYFALGAGIQYIVPAFLVYLSRKKTKQAIGVGVVNQHQSIFKSTFWIFFVNLWAIGSVVLVTWNHIATAVKH